MQEQERKGRTESPEAEKERIEQATRSSVGFKSEGPHMDSQTTRKFITQTFLKGLSVILPVAIALYAIFWLIWGTERTVQRLLSTILPEGFYLPGLGIIVFVGVVFLLGLLMYPWLTRSLFGFVDSLMRRVPLFGSVYSPLKDLMDLFGEDIEKKLGQPVMIRVPNTNMRTLGFITQQSGEGLPEGMIPEGHVTVYLQWTSQVGGYCFIVPRDHVSPVDLSVEEGLRWAITAGLSRPKK